MGAGKGCQDLSCRLSTKSSSSSSSSSAAAGRVIMPVIGWSRLIGFEANLNKINLKKLNAQM